MLALSRGIHTGVLRASGSLRTDATFHINETLHASSNEILTNHRRFLSFSRNRFRGSDCECGHSDDILVLVGGFGIILASVAGASIYFTLKNDGHPTLRDACESYDEVTLKEKLNRLEPHRLEALLEYHPTWIKFVRNPTQATTLATMQYSVSTSAQAKEIFRNSVHRKNFAFCELAYRTSNAVFEVIADDLSYHVDRDNLTFVQTALEYNPYFILKLGSSYIRNARHHFGINLWETAIRENWKLIRDCPVEYQTEQVCEAAANQCKSAIDFIQDAVMQRSFEHRYNYSRPQSHISDAHGCAPHYWKVMPWRERQYNRICAWWNKTN